MMTMTTKITAAMVVITTVYYIVCYNVYGGGGGIPMCTPPGVVEHRGVNYTRDHCDVRWGTGRGLALGQNLEDAIILARFFGGGSRLRGGVFVEMGALDGVVFSNTLALEHCLGWTGLLIEANPTNAAECRRNRPCTPLYAGAACRLPQTTVLFRNKSGGTARIGAGITVSVPCKPLSAVFEEHGIRHISFFSLDVEGGELGVLQTIDWTRVAIEVLMVETTARASPDEPEKTRAVRAYLGDKMTRVPSRVRDRFLSISGSDVYVHDSLLAADKLLWEVVDY